MVYNVIIYQSALSVGQLFLILTAFEDHGTVLSVERIFLQFHWTRQCCGNSRNKKRHKTHKNFYLILVFHAMHVLFELFGDFFRFVWGVWGFVWGVNLLDDVPQVTVVRESKQTVGSCDGVKGSRLFVAKKRVRHPDLVPGEVWQFHLRDEIVFELKTRVVPTLSQVEADWVILNQTISHCDVISTSTPFVRAAGALEMYEILKCMGE